MTKQRTREDIKENLDNSIYPEEAYRKINIELLLDIRDLLMPVIEGKPIDSGECCEKCEESIGVICFGCPCHTPPKTEEIQGLGTDGSYPLRQAKDTQDSGWEEGLKELWIYDKLVENHTLGHIKLFIRQEKAKSYEEGRKSSIEEACRHINLMENEWKNQAIDKAVEEIDRMKSRCNCVENGGARNSEHFDKDGCPSPRINGYNTALGIFKQKLIGMKIGDN